MTARTPVRLVFAVFGVLGAILLAALVLPLAGLSASIPDAAWQEVWDDPRTADALRTSVVTSTCSMAIITALGVPFGYVLARGRVRGRQLLIGIVALPMVIPGLAGGIVLLQAFGPNGFVGRWLAELGIIVIGSPLGVMLAQLYVASPFVIISSMVAFGAVDPKLEAAAATLGDSPWHVFRRVALPLAWPAIIAGLVLGWIRALGEFGATMIVSYNPKTLPVYLWVRFESRGLAGALPIAIVLVGVAVLAVLAWRLLIRAAAETSAHVPDPLR